MILFLNLIKLTKSDFGSFWVFILPESSAGKMKAPHGPIYWQGAVINASGKLKGGQVWDVGWW